MPRRHALPLACSVVLLASLVPAGAAPLPPSPAWDPSSLPVPPPHAVRGLALAAALSAVEDRAPPGLDASVAAAGEALRWRAELAGAAWPAAAPSLGHEPPSLLLAELATATGHLLDPDASARLAVLDGLPPRVRASLGGVLAAFLELHAAARAAYAPAWAQTDAMAFTAAPLPAPRASSAEFGRVLAAQDTFLRAAQALGRAVGEAPEGPLPPGPVVLAPLLDLDLAGGATVHAEDVLLLLDLGGHDVYANNAGGNVLRLPAVPDPGPWPLPCGLLAGGGHPAIGLTAAAAAVDYGGDDTYGRLEEPRCGVHGGANLGAGLLLDAGGSDTYTSAHRATNGGALLGAALLVDGGGDDQYLGGSWGTNGGGTGFFPFVDLPTQGALLDLGEGRDRYVMLGFRDRAGGNGGGVFQGQGLLWDGGGDDVYEAGSAGVIGGGGAGFGFLLDRGGHDAYLASRAEAFGANGGGVGGSGFLWDGGAGSDRYEAGDFGANGGGGGDGFQPVGGVGYLRDEGGDDAYVAGSLGTNGGAAWLGGQGFLLDLAGHDTYVAADAGANGGGHFGGRGLLYDAAGDDRYEAGAEGVNGGAGGCVFFGATCVVPVPATGLLLDAAGRDVYLDLEGGAGVDRTVVPKGLVGAQVDLRG